MHRSLIINASQDHCSQTSGPGPQIHAHLILFATVAHVMAPWFQVCWIRWSSPSQCRTIRRLPPISNQSMFLYPPTGRTPTSVCSGWMCSLVIPHIADILFRFQLCFLPSVSHQYMFPCECMSYLLFFCKTCRLLYSGWVQRISRTLKWPFLLHC